MDRLPPTSYCDAQERWHPGPSAPGYREHMVACEPCLAHFIRAGVVGESWALAMPPVVQPVFVSGPGEGAIVAAPRALPARWRRYAAPVPIVSGAIGFAGAWLLPSSVGGALIILLLVVAVAIHKYAPNAVPVARVVRAAR